MARTHDSNGVLLGGINTSPARPKFLPPTATPTGIAQNETVVGLECRYGSFAYSYSDLAYSVRQAARFHRCHNPIESPEERNHCDLCGGEYCTVHAEPAQHDCRHIRP